jgi:hypothetical protein
MREEEQQRSEKKCPVCGSDVQQKAIKCKTCHHWLNTRFARKQEAILKEKKEKSNRTCPYCAEEVPDYAFICMHCLESIHHKVIKEVAQKKSDVYYQHNWKLVLFSIFTLNFYQVYWFYRNWKFIKNELKLKVHPIIKVLLLFVPVLGLITIFYQFKSINEFAKHENIEKPFYPLIVLIIWLIFLVEGIIFIIAAIINPQIGDYVIMTSIIGLLSVFPLILVQDTINFIILSTQPGLKVSKRITLIDIIVITLGVVIWILFYMFLHNLKQYI